MSLFLLTFLLIYGSVHAYALLKVKAAFALGWGTTLPFLPLLALLLFAPILTYLLERHGLETAARVFAFVGYTWMGLLFLFMTLNLAADAVTLATRIGSAVAGGNGNRGAVAFDGRRTILFLAALAVSLGAYSAFEASRIGVVRLRIVTDKLPASVPRLRIAQISDLHLGLINRHRMTRAVAEILRDASPDLLVSTGDLVDGRIDHIPGLAEIFRAVPAPRGKFAVTGNHEYYAGLPQALSFTRRAGFTVLRDDDADVSGILRFAGVDDPAAPFGNASDSAEGRILDGPSPAPFTVLLKHRPALRPASAGKFDLQLSGHTHGGQIFPFRFVSRLAYPLGAGDHPVEGGGTLHVSRGTGTWGPPMRFLAPPEITIIDIERSPAAS